MSDVDPTPDTQTTVGDRLSWMRGDAAAQSAAQLAALAALAGEPAGNLGQLASQLAALAGTPAGNLGQLASQSAAQLAALAALAGEPAGNLGQLASQLATLAGAWNYGEGITPYNILDNLYIQAVDTNNRLDKIQAVLGADPYTSTETGNIRAILLSLLSAQGNSGIAPDNAGDAIGAALTVTQNGRRYVVWGSPIEGLTRSNNNIDLTPVTSWTGYSLYVQTAAEDCWVGVNQNVPTNSWMEAPLTGTVQVSVASNYSVRAYMRTPSLTYQTIASQLLSGGVHNIPFPGYTRNQYGENQGDGKNKSFRFVSGTPVRSSGGPGGLGDPRIGYEPGVFRRAYPNLTIGQWYHISVTTTSFQVYSYLSSFSVDWAQIVVPGSIALP